MKLKKLIQTGVLSLAVLSAGMLSSILSPTKAEAEAAGLTEYGDNAFTVHFTSDTPLFTDNSATQQAATAKAGTEALVTGDTTNGYYEVKGSVADDGTFTDGKDGTAYYMMIPADAASATFVPDADYENAWTFDGTYTDADCDDKGSFEETNSITGETRENDIDKAAHFEGEMKTTKKPGLFTAGKREAKCLICGDTVESEKIPSKFSSWWKGIFSSKADKKKTADEKKELDEKNEERKGEKDGLKDTVKTALSSAALSDADTKAFTDAVENTDEVKDLVSLNAAIAEKAGNSADLASAQAAAREFIAGRSTARAEAAAAEQQALLAAQAAAETNRTESAETETSDPYTSSLQVRKYQIDGVKPRHSSPELPYGCEVTTLTVALNYAGYPCEKTDLSENYLPKGTAEAGTDPYYFYVGNPAVTDKSYGCFAPALEQCAVNFGASVIDLSSPYVTIDGQKMPDKRADFDALLSWVAKNVPVIAWTSIDMRLNDPMGSYTYMHNGRMRRWQTGEHCVLITGFDLDADTITVADPDDGALMTYNLSAFRQIWIKRDCQAFVVT